MLSVLYKHILGLTSISSDELAKVSTLFKLKRVKKNGHLLQIGQLCDQYYFVVSGALKSYYQSNDQFITNWIAFEGYFFTELESYTCQHATRYGIQALEDSQVLLLSRADMDHLLLTVPAWQIYTRRNLEMIFLKLLDVVVAFQSKTTEEQYQELFKHSEFMQRIKQKDIASILGTSPYAISRIRRKK